MNNDKTVVIIISRYNEDLKWTIEGIFNEFKYIVYNKGDNEDFEKTNVSKIINLLNVGRCAHTYLYHIVANYDNLADIEVLLPGSLDLEYKRERAIQMLTRVKLDKNAVFIGEYSPDVYSKFKNFKLDNWLSSHGKNASKNKESKLTPCTVRPFGNWFNRYFGNKIQITFFAYWDVFSIDKRDIVQHPVSRYKTFLESDYLDTSSDPEVGHYFERSWCAVFHPMKHTKKINRPF